MYNIKFENYVPKPSPATSDRIVAAHYYAAWKKGAPGLHNGFDDLHPFPERTPIWQSWPVESQDFPQNVRYSVLAKYMTIWCFLRISGRS